MILKGSQRGGAKQLANHLLRGEENEHVELHEVRGFLSQNPDAAFKEMHAISQGTKCRQFMFSLSLSPPAKESASIDAYEKALDAVERKLGLEGQPRVVVFHEKEGRRHAHCVWSRIDAENMKAIQLSHYKMKLRDLSKELYMENGWQLPNGLVDSKQRDPYNFSLAEWQQAKRQNEDPRMLKALFQECWATSKSKEQFAKALEERGYNLAQGDRRGFVAVDFKGEVYSLSRWAGVKNKEITAKLGNAEELPTVDQAKAQIASRMTATLEKHANQVTETMRREASPLLTERIGMTIRHKGERQLLKERQAKRWQQEEQARAKRLPRGIKGIWHRITGSYQRIRARNEQETQDSTIRDRDQKQALIDKQMEERQVLQQRIADLRQKQREAMQGLKEDLAHYMGLQKAQPAERKQSQSAVREQSQMRKNSRQNSR
jgi:hypothetical protein